MKIGLIDIDHHNFPNLVLMKLSAYHKAQGDSVQWYDMFSGHFDRVYIAKVFTFSEDYKYPIDADEVIRGGSGYNIRLIDGSETGTSFRQALYFKDECGLNIHDTMIWAKDGGGAIGSNLSYTQNFEYMFVFSNGKPKTVNLIYDKPSQTYTGKAQHVRECRGGNDKGDRGNVTLTRLEMSRRNNWWYLVPQKEEGSDFHPAVYPLKLAREHIYSWTNESDLVLDPFMGSGTTAVACIKEKRHFIGFELNKEYFDKACKRVDIEQRQLKLF